MLLSSSSNGNSPHTIAYKLMPRLQISILVPSYFFPVSISGAAYKGEPHAFSNNLPFSNFVLRPKSDNLASPYSLSKIFSGFISL